MQRWYVHLLLFTIFSLECAQAQSIKSITRVSLSPGQNAQGKSFSYDPHMDKSGRFIIFTSAADNFAAEGKVTGKFHEHVYLRDTLTNTTTQLDVTSEGRTGSPGMFFNPDVRTFSSSFDPHLSGDGNYAVFTTGESDISPDGAGERDGNWAYLKNLVTGDIRRIPFATAGDPTKLEYPTFVAINNDGSVVVVISMLGDIDCASCPWELTVFDRNSNTTTLLDMGLAGNKFNPTISDDGRFIAFENQVGNFSAKMYAYLYDRELSQLTALNDGNESLSPALSGDGKYIAYTDTSVIPSRIKLRERETGSEIVISGGLNGAEPTGINEFASLSQDGRYTAFLSTADNLVRGDTNNTDDIFVYDRVTGKTTLVSVQGSCEGTVSQEEFNTGPPTISADGSSVTFTVLERLIAANREDESGRIIELADTNTFDDVYYATIDYNAAPSQFQKGLVPDTPFVSVNCKGAVARIQLEEILPPSSSPSSKKNGVKKITREVVIRKAKTSGRSGDLRRTTAKKNTVTTGGLPNGTYTVQVRGKAKLQNGRTAQTKLSKAAKFTISK